VIVVGTSAREAPILFACAVAIGWIGVVLQFARGTAYGNWGLRWTRDERPKRFWFGMILQIVLLAAMSLYLVHILT